MTLTTSAETEVARFREIKAEHDAVLEKFRAAERAMQEAKNAWRDMYVDFSRREDAAGLAIASSWLQHRFAGMDDDAKRQEVAKLGEVFANSGDELERLGWDVFGEQIGLFVTCREDTRMGMARALSEQYLPRALAAFGFEDVVSQWRSFKNASLERKHFEAKNVPLVEEAIDCGWDSATVRGFPMPY